ncbi:MAG TPA: diacylglycerol kinase [Xanthomonadales bacterium]|nr:diacylglycerol kinase [Xanthomonadales bacterium]
MKPGKTGMARLVDATRNSSRGLRATFTNEAAFRQELLLVAVLGVASFWAARNVTEWLLLVLPLGILLITELLNSAVECVVDRIGEEVNELSGRAKDMGSAAVLIALATIVLAWGAVAWGRFNG